MISHRSYILVNAKYTILKAYLNTTLLAVHDLLARFLQVMVYLYNIIVLFLLFYHMFFTLLTSEQLWSIFYQS